MYILDEPSIGLHPKDTEKLIVVLHRLRDLGNTVIVVEHEEDIMHAADEIVDFGRSRRRTFWWRSSFPRRPQEIAESQEQSNGQILIGGIEDSNSSETQNLQQLHSDQPEPARTT